MVFSGIQYGTVDKRRALKMPPPPSTGEALILREEYH